MRSTVRPSIRQRLGALVVDGFFNGMSGLGRLHPRSRPSAHGLEVLRDRSYLPGGNPAHHYDVYRPIGTTSASRLPVVLYVHGGGFRILSKDTHWVMALALARRGYVVFNVNYRLSREAPFPAAVEDICAAYQHVVEHAGSLGGDVQQLVVAGESAGGNLATMLALAACSRREEPFARAVFDTGVVPKIALPACALLQVTDPQRFSRRRRIHPLVQDRIDEVSHGYLGAWGLEPHGHPTLDLADPLLLLERDATTFERPLPSFFVPCGTADPLLEDSRRLARALKKRGADVEEAYYPGGVHAFHAFVFHGQAQRCWRDTYRFLDQRLEVRGDRGPRADATV
jgi:acetyl esterase